MKHLHTRASCVNKKLTHVLGDKAKVLGNYLCLRINLCYLTEKLYSGSLIPLTVTRGGISVRNIVISRKAAEMVNSQNIVKRKRKSYAVYPPREAVLLHKLPVIYRVTPKLTVRREAVGGTSCNNRRIKVTVKQELLGSRPYVHTVVSNVDRHIANYHYSLFVRVLNYILPL